MALTPTDLNVLFAQIMQQQNQQRNEMFAAVRDPYARFGMGIGNVIDGLTGAQDPRKNAQYKVAEAQNEVLKQTTQGLDMTNPTALRTRGSALLQSPNADDQRIGQEMLNRSYELQKILDSERQAKLTADRTEQQIEEGALTIEEKEFNIKQLKDDDAQRAIDKTVDKHIGSIGRYSAETKGAYARKSEQLRSQGKYLEAKLLDAWTTQQEQALEEKSTFERQLATALENKEITAEEAAKIRREYLINESTKTSTVKNLSPEQQARYSANINEMNRAIGLVEELKAIIIEDPTRVGAAGGLRRLFQAGVETAGSAGSLIPFLNDVSGWVADTVFEKDSDREQYAFDPDIATLKNIENSLIFAIARARQPEGRLLSRTLELAEQDAKLTGLTGADSINNRLDQIAEQLARAVGDNTFMLEQLAGHSRGISLGEKPKEVAPPEFDLDAINKELEGRQ